MFTCRIASRLLVGLLATAWVAGCGSSSAPKTIKAQGKVTFDGKSLGVGRVIFQPVKPAEGCPSRPAIGSLQADGSFELSSFQPGDGLVPGEYQIAVNTQTSGPTPENPNAPEVWAAPRRYGNPATSGLSATVPADARHTLEFNFNLKKW